MTALRISINYNNELHLPQIIMCETICEANQKGKKSRPEASNADWKISLISMNYFFLHV